MTDDRLSHLFAEGTAPERDAAFAARVGAEIGGLRLRRRLLALALRAAMVLLLAGAVFFTARAVGPALTQLAEGWPQFMGVPVPLVLGALFLTLALRARRYLLPRMV